MRVNLICCAVTYVVLLILLETSGAPTCDCSKSDDRLISHTIEKENSKSSAKVEKEDIEDTESESCCKNGLVSGAKSITQSRELSQAEIEKSRLAEEKKTTKGTEKSETDMTKKKLVSVSEKKSILVYYMVSYRKLPTKREDESRVDYYKRVFPIEDNKIVFLRKIFKCYEGEKPSDYMDRVDYMFTMVYPEQDIRLDINYLQVFDHYYTLKYSRKIDETDECYFPRVLKKWCKESNEHYKKRMQCLVAALDEEDFCHITFDDSETGYKIGCRKTPAKTRSSPSSTGEVIGQFSSSVKKSKQEKENVDASETSIKQSNEKGTSSENKKNLKKSKTLIETEEDTKAYAYRVAYTKLPKKTPGELDKIYYKRFFGEFKKDMTQDARNELYLRILIQYKGENCTEYIKRIDFLFDECYPQMDIRTNKILMGLLDHYYQEKYKKCAGETEEVWFNRVLKKMPGETVQHYNDRVECLKITFEDVDWSKVNIDSKTGTFKFISGKTTQPQGCTKESKTIEDIKKTFAKKSGEDDISYYKRIVGTKYSSTSDKYTETMLKIYQAYPDLDCWCNIKYRNIMKDCYTKMYGKKQCETDEQYIKKLMTKYPFETDKQCYDRLFVIYECNPNSNIWWEKKYLDYTQKAYEWWYKKTSADVSVEEYYKRIVTKCDTETEETYLKKMNFIRNYVCPNLDLWYSNKYKSIIECYYTTLYTKQKGETEESYYKRIVKKEPCDTSPEIYIQRMDMVHQVTVTCPVWCDEKFYESCTKQYYDTFTKTLSIDKCEEERYKRIAFRYPLETEECYVKRLTLIESKYSTLKMWYDSKYYSCTKSFYTLRYAKTSSESEDARIERIFKREPCDTNNNIYHDRMMMIRCATVSCPAWYDAKYYDRYTKDLYSYYYKKGANEACDKWLTKAIKQMDGESKECAVKRVALIKKCTSSCGCWTSDNFSKVKCSKGISSEYYELIKKTYFSSDVQYEKKSSSSSSSSCSASSSEEDSEVVIKRGVC